MRKFFFVFYLFSFCTVLFSTASFSTPKPEVEKPSWKGKVSVENIRISNLYGDVRLRYGGDNNELEYLAVIQHLETKGRLRVTHSINKGIFSIKSSFHDTKNSSSEISLARVDLVVFVPKGKNVSVETSSGLIDAKGVDANISAQSESGKIILNGVKGWVSTKNNSGNTQVTLKKLKYHKKLSFESITGNISVWVNPKADFLVNMNTSSDIITDFSIKIKKFKNKEPRKRGVVNMNSSKSTLVLNTKRGVLALRDFE